jgi:glutamate-ammonia-ligase adenylyltransferase
VDTAGVAEIKAVKDRIEASARRAGGERNVKLGPGCIRDIEFTVQLLQLVFGAGDPTVRRRSTLGALRALGSAGYLTPMEHKTLASGYVFLRTVEHQLQLMHGLGVRELPGSPEALDKLARRLDFPEDASTVPAEFLLGEYRRHTGNVRGLFRKLFAEMFEERDEADIRARSLVFLPDEPTEEETGALAAFGLRDTARAAATLRRLARGTVAAPLPASAAEAFADLAPRILRAASKTPDPDASLTQFERFCGLIGSHGALYSVLAEAPPVTELLIRVAGCSASLSAILAAHPEYFDMLMDPLLMSAPRTADKLAGELAVRLEETRTGEAGMKVIGRFRRRELLRIGVRDLMGDADVLTTMRELSALGDVCLQAALAAVAPEVVDHPADGLPFAVVGLGKLAGRELHYNSDLDVVFVWGECEGGPSDRQAAYMRLAGEIMARATAATSGEGPPLRLDARLRPEGNSGPLARSVASCREYYAGRAEPWERLALVRLRPVAGSPAVAEEFGQVIEQFVWGRGLSPAELDEIVHLKGRMERERAKTAGGLIDVKLGPGGISDIEFCVQLLQLAHGHAEPTVRAPGTLDGLRALARAGAFPSEQDGAALEAAYLFLRALECRLQIAQAWDQSTVSPGAVDRLERLMDRPGREDRPPAEALAGELDRHRRLARGLYEATVERLAGRSADTPGGVSSV